MINNTFYTAKHNHVKFLCESGEVIFMVIYESYGNVSMA